ncbi:MAG: hypothetical protein GVY18_05835 [Bacteroidetes bacterium]|jgi:hypothetical protein|nr:hypothetical protein [Bacteroidota bacterium]
MSRLLFLAVLLLLAGPPQTATAQATEHGLEAFIPDSTALPEGCAPRPLDDSAPPYLTSNPMASDDSTFVQAVARGVFRGDTLEADPEATLIAVYQTDDEMGVFAFRFADDALAQQARDAARTSGGVQILQTRGPVLVMVWREGPEDACYTALEKHVTSVLAGE